MKILYFLAHPDAIGGAVKVLITQAYIMQMRGELVQIVIQNDENDNHIYEYEQLCNNLNLKYTAMQYSIATSIENIDIARTITALERIEKLVRDFAPDIIHSVQLNISVEYVARKLKIPHIMNIYQICEGMFNIKWADVLPKYHSCDSEYYCRKWKEGLKVETECIRVAYDKNRVQSQNNNGKRNANRIELINLACFTEYKRQLEILKFIKKAKECGYNVHISFLGENRNQYGRKCRNYVEANGLETEVSFRGFVLEVEKYLLRADLMVHASTAESYPGVIVEAMANRVPILATPVAGIPELLKDGINGFLASGYNFEDLFQGFIHYLRHVNDHSITNIIDNAYKTFLDNHSFESVGGKLEMYYQKVSNSYKKEESDAENMMKIFQSVRDFGTKKNINFYKDETKEKLWFIYHINDIVEKNNYKTAAIWGAGKLGKVAIDFCKILSLNIVSFIDCFKEGEIEGIKIIRPDADVIRNVDVVFLAMADVDACNENIVYIEQAGKRRNVNYFLILNNSCIQSGGNHLNIVK